MPTIASAKAPRPRQPRKTAAPQHKFRNKLLLNQWLISLFGIDPLQQDAKTRPFHALADALKDPKLEGLDHNNLHFFYTALINTNMFWDQDQLVTKAQLLAYEENIVSHTQELNEHRDRPITWKYYQWLTLLFVEIYLDRNFSDCERLLDDLNAYLHRFNLAYPNHAPVPRFEEDDLNKLCLQLATGSGKTLIMHINLRQYEHYARKHGQAKELSRVILLTPNYDLSVHHVDDLTRSGVSAQRLLDTPVAFNGL